MLFSEKYLIIKNNSKTDIRLNIKNNCVNYELFYPFGINTLNIEALLNPGQIQVIVGIREKYYETYNFNLTLLSHDTPKDVPIFTIINCSNKSPRRSRRKSSKKIELFRSNFIQEGIIYNDFVNEKNIEVFFENVPDMVIDKNYYDFIFKKINIDDNDIIENIDYKKMQKTFLKINIQKKWK